jgi:hypothetical protein
VDLLGPLFLLPFPLLLLLDPFFPFLLVVLMSLFVVVHVSPLSEPWGRR